MPPTRRGAASCSSPQSMCRAFLDGGTVATSRRRRDSEFAPLVRATGARSITSDCDSRTKRPHLVPSQDFMTGRCGGVGDELLLCPNAARDLRLLPARFLYASSSYRSNLRSAGRRWRISCRSRLIPRHCARPGEESEADRGRLMLLSAPIEIARRRRISMVIDCQATAWLRRDQPMLPHLIAGRLSWSMHIYCSPPGHGHAPQLAHTPRAATISSIFMQMSIWR